VLSDLLMGRSDHLVSSLHLGRSGRLLLLIVEHPKDGFLLLLGGRSALETKTRVKYIK
jgi:hypothetical protein